ncbi:MAG: hypothetical protein JWN08_2476 [Frankiales bacterium]|nr:hypothetical protein [Frankiales bacterium]
MAFEGFPEQALVFYEGLRADNSKAYWTDSKPLYDRAVKAPMEALIADLAPEFGTAKFFRPYRDVRFSKDKTPYKDHAAAVVEGSGTGGALYVQLSADGLYVGGGYWHTHTDQVQRLRAAVDDDLSGRALVAVLDALDGWEVIGEQLKRLPKPYEPDHPRADLLRHKSLAAGLSFEPAEWLHEPECGERVADAWRAVQPLNAWLAQHVGPTREPHRPRGG